MSDDVGATYGPEPLAVLSVSDSELLLSGSRGTFRIPREKVRRIGRGKMYPWLFSAVRIQHDVPGFPPELQFKPIDAKPGDVRRNLKAAGFPVS